MLFPLPPMSLADIVMWLLVIVGQSLAASSYWPASVALWRDVFPNHAFHPVALDA